MSVSKIYNIDCVEYLRSIPDRFFDLAIVDPPYGLSKNSSNGSGKLKSRVFNKCRIANLMPHHIRITDVKVESLLDISDDDIMREGIRKESFAGGCMFCYNKAYIRNGNRRIEPIYNSTPRRAFASLMYKIIGGRTWESNPWVVAYSFELVD